MDAIKNLFSGPTGWYFIVIGAVIIIYGIFMIIHMSNKKKKNDAFESEHPEAAKVYLKQGMDGIYSTSITVFTVNGVATHTFYKGTKSGFYLLPGESEIQVQAGYSRPGVMYKNVTTTVGPLMLKVTAEAQKSYTISLNRKENKFEFTEE